MTPLRRASFHPSKEVSEAPRKPKPKPLPKVSIPLRKFRKKNYSRTPPLQEPCFHPSKEVSEEL